MTLLELDKAKTVCPLPWLQLSVHADTRLRVCCNSGADGFVHDSEGELVYLDKVNSLENYFNLPWMKQVRSEMLKGQKPQACRKCFLVEDSGGKSIRQCLNDEYKHNEAWHDQFNKTQADGSIDVNLQSIDMGLSNKCNIKCVMCEPSFSYSLKSDFDKLNLGYDVEFAKRANTLWNDNQNLMQMMQNAARANTVNNILTTGGEPFLSKVHQQILQEFIDSNSAKDILLRYHTNCTVQNKKLFEMWNNFKLIDVHLSIDAFGELDEYIRFGTKWSTLEEVVSDIIGHEKTKCDVHTTINILNIFSLPTLYEWIKTKEVNHKLPFHIWMDGPEWLALKVLPPEMLRRARKKLTDYFANVEIKDPDFFKDPICVERKTQIISYIDRAISEGQDIAKYEECLRNLRSLEGLRENGPVDKIVPELKELFKVEKKGNQFFKYLRSIFQTKNL